MRGFWMVAALALVGSAGCGSEEGSVKLVPVTGKVTLNGKPLANAMVSFMPDQTNADSTPSTDTTGPEGNYMMMWKNRTGLAPGKYTVVVTPSTETPPDPRYEQFKDDPYMAQVSAGGNTIPGTKKNTDLTKSEFPAEVGNESTTLDFDVKGKASAGDSAKK